MFMGSSRLILVVTLEVRKDAAAAFERFETQAAAILSRWEGRIERVIRLDEVTSGDTFQEVHIVSFRDQGAFDAYRRDPDLAALKSLRDGAIVRTEVVQGRDLSTFGGAE